MARVIRQSPLEIYVKQWLKANTVRRKAGLDLLRRAAAYINEKIATDCCDPLNPVIDLYTRKESVFVRDVYTMLYGMSRQGNIQTLTRTRDAILAYIAGCCDNIVLIGDIYNVSNWTSLADFSNTAGFSIVGGKIVAAPDASLTQQILLNGTTMLDQEVFSVTYTWNSTSANDAGLNIEYKSVNVHVDENLIGYVSLKADANFGQLVLKFKHGLSTNVYTSPTNPLSGTTLGDTITLSITCNKGVYTLNAVNNTKGLSGSLPISYSFTFGGLTQGTHNTAQLAIAQTQGGYTIQNITHSSIQQLGPQLLAVGDSITRGLWAGSAAARWGALIGASIEAGSGDTTAEVLLNVPQIINTIKPKIVVLLIGVNDLALGIPTLTWQANYKSICTQLTVAGIKVIKLCPLPTFEVDTSVFKTFLETTYPDGTVIDSYTPFLGTGNFLNPLWDAGDGVHPNGAGNAKLAALIQDSGKIYG